MDKGNEHVWEIGISNSSMHLYILLLRQINLPTPTAITTVSLGVNIISDYKQYRPLYTGDSVGQKPKCLHTNKLRVTRESTVSVTVDLISANSWSEF
jgi:hypothetical protein